MTHQNTSTDGGLKTTNPANLPYHIRAINVERISLDDNFIPFISVSWISRMGHVFYSRKEPVGFVSDAVKEGDMIFPPFDFNGVEVTQTLLLSAPEWGNTTWFEVSEGFKVALAAYLRPPSMARYRLTRGGEVYTGVEREKDGDRVQLRLTRLTVHLIDDQPLEQAPGAGSMQVATS